jgi:hypothetical protein
MGHFLPILCEIVGQTRFLTELNWKIDSSIWLIYIQKRLLWICKSFYFTIFTFLKILPHSYLSSLKHKFISLWVKFFCKAIDLILARIMCCNDNNSRIINIAWIINISNLFKSPTSFYLLINCLVNCFSVDKLCSTIDIKENTLNTRSCHKLVASPSLKVKTIYPFALFLIVKCWKFTNLEEIKLLQSFFHNWIET